LQSCNRLWDLTTGLKNQTQYNVLYRNVQCITTPQHFVGHEKINQIRMKLMERVASAMMLVDDRWQFLLGMSFSTSVAQILDSFPHYLASEQECISEQPVLHSLDADSIIK
jgi:hypothetical protein